MEKRHIIALIMIAIGGLLILGAMGEAEFTENYGRAFLTRSIIGAMLIFFAIPVSGDLGDNER